MTGAGFYYTPQGITYAPPPPEKSGRAINITPSSNRKFRKTIKVFQMQGGKRKGAGRKKGVPNKTTASVKESLERAYEAIGSDEAFAAWATSNKTDFYKLWHKLLPAKIEGDLDAKIKIEIVKVT